VSARARGCRHTAVFGTCRRSAPQCLRESADSTLSAGTPRDVPHALVRYPQRSFCSRSRHSKRLATLEKSPPLLK
jgi:hypothetical protein